MHVLKWATTQTESSRERHLFNLGQVLEQDKPHYSGILADQGKTTTRNSKRQDERLRGKIEQQNGPMSSDNIVKLLWNSNRIKNEIYYLYCHLKTLL